MPVGPARMPLLDHLGELRRRLMIVVLSLLVAAIVLYFATPTLIDIFIDPIRSFLPEGSLYLTTALGGFSIRFRVAIFFAAIVCSPIIIWEIMAFFLPALTEKERKWVVPTVAALVALFFLGMLFAWLFIQRPAFQWMTGESKAFGNILPDAESYLGIMIGLELGFGVAFELPLIVFYLTILHIVPYATFRRSWRAIYVGILIFAAMVTPDASPITMAFMYAALMMLYEISLFVARQVIVAREGREALKWSREDYEAAKEAADA